MVQVCKEHDPDPRRSMPMPRLPVTCRSAIVQHGGSGDAADSFNWWTGCSFRLGAALIGGGASLVGGRFGAKWVAEEQRKVGCLRPNGSPSRPEN
jgi:hypothetical protein